MGTLLMGALWVSTLGALWVSTLEALWAIMASILGTLWVSILEALCTARIGLCGFQFVFSHVYLLLKRTNSLPLACKPTGQSPLGCNWLSV